MKVISNLLGRTVALINIDEWLPQQGLDVAKALPLMVERYGFTISPSLSDPAKKFRDDGVKFENGRLITTSGSEHVIEDLTLWPDGLVVNAHTTDGAKAFLDDLLTWGNETLGFRAKFSAVTNRLYVSHLVVEFEASLAAKLRVLWPISKAFHEALQNTYSQDIPRVELTTMRFDYDHAIAPAAFRTVGPFVIERRENHRFENENVFFASAPLSTEDHIKLLQQFESIMAALP